MPLKTFPLPTKTQRGTQREREEEHFANLSENKFKMK